MKVTLDRNEVEKAIVKYVRDEYLQYNNDLVIDDVTLTDNCGIAISDGDMFSAEANVVKRPKPEPMPAAAPQAPQVPWQQ